MPDADLSLVVHPLCNQGSRIDPGCEFATLQQLGVNRDVFVFRIHVLNAGHADRTRVSQGSLNRVQALLVGERRHDFVDEVHGGIFESSRRIAFCVAHDGSARRIWGGCRDPR